MRTARTVLLVAGFLSAFVPPVAEAHETTAAAGDSASASLRAGEAPMIAALRENGASILALGERGGLDGHLVELADGDAYGLYVTADGHAVAGLLYGPDGALLTGRQIAAAGARRELAQDIPGDGVVQVAHGYGDRPALPQADGLFERSASAFGFTLGRAGPLVVLFADPACRWSRSAVARLGQTALDGRLRLRVVPVGVLGAASAQEAAAIASADDPALAWFEGTGAAPLPEGGRRIEDNNALYDRWGARAVPLIVWRTRDGRIARRLGDVDDVTGWLEALPRE